MSTILVTGATGNVGGKVVNQLAAAGFKVRAAVRNPSKAENLKSANVELAELDYSKPETYAPALKGVEKVFLVMSPMPGIAELTSSFAKAAKAAGVKHIVKLSAHGASDTPTYGMAGLHLTAEKALAESGVPFTNLRPSMFMQNFFMNADSIKTIGKFFMAVGNTTVSFIDTRDIATAAVGVLIGKGHEGKTYTITGTKAISHHEAAKQLAKASGREVVYVDIPPEAAAQGMKDSGMPEMMVGAMIDLMKYTKNGGFSVVTSDYKKITGKAATSFNEFAKDFSEAFK